MNENQELNIEPIGKPSHSYVLEEQVYFLDEFYKHSDSKRKKLLRSFTYCCEKPLFLNRHKVIEQRVKQGWEPRGTSSWELYKTHKGKEYMIEYHEPTREVYV